MCHHKAPHRPSAPAPRHARLFENETIPVPESFVDDYKNRAPAAGAARMRVSTDMNYDDLGLAWPEGLGHPWHDELGATARAKLPAAAAPSNLVLLDSTTAERVACTSRRGMD